MLKSVGALGGQVVFSKRCFLYYEQDPVLVSLCQSCRQLRFEARTLFEESLNLAALLAKGCSLAFTSQVRLELPFQQMA